MTSREAPPELAVLGGHPVRTLDLGDSDATRLSLRTEPDLAGRVLGGSAEPRRCRNSNFCVPAEMLGMKGTCYNPDVKKTTGAAS